MLTTNTCLTQPKSHTTMIKKLLVLSLLCAAVSVSYAADATTQKSSTIEKVAMPSASTPFGKLKSIKIDDTVTIYYDSSFTEVINKKQGAEYEGGVRVLKTKIDKNSQQSYTIDYSPGPSADPAFVFLKNDGDKVAEQGEQISGLELYIPGNGFLYVSGHTNNMFDMRRKYKIDGDALVEVKQPFYYVGINNKLKKDLEIFSDAELKQSVGLLTKGTDVSVLLYQDEKYLIKSTFGLVGWAKIPDSQMPGEVIDGIYYAGD